MRILIAALAILVLTGCSMKDPLAQLPDREFETFEYHRYGPIGNTHIIAKDGIKVGDMVEIGHVDANMDYGPMMPKFVIKLRGYKK